MQVGGLGAAAGLAPSAAQPAAAKVPAGRGPAIRRMRSNPPQKGLPTTPGAGIIALNRMGFGPRPGEIEAFNNLGATDEQRMAVYAAWQLNPDTIGDAGLDGRLAAVDFESIGIDSNPDSYRATLWDWYINNNAPSGNTSSSLPRDELTRATFLRAMYSKKQLLEVLVDFWLNHFNVNINHSSFVRTMYAHMELEIRLQAMGNFRTLLESVARSTAMLYYLDNYTSSNAGPNENFSRELFELHTLGAENYLGVLQQHQVPTDSDGRPVGYVDADVFEATRAFTGWSFSYGQSGDGDTGLFYYRSEWHDRFQKNVLGVFMPQDQPALKDGRDVLDALASHPGTGRYIARKLCRRFIADEPPQSLIDTVSALFTAQWQAPDQLKQVYEAILLSEAFRTTWGEKIKRPFEITVSAMRAAGADFNLRMDDSDTSSFLNRYDDTGQELFTWPAPNGFPDVRGAWQSMTPRVACWRLCNWLIDFDNNNGDYYLDVLGQTPPGVRSSNELADFWIQRILYRPMETADREEIVQFMAQGINPDFDLNLDDSDTRDRLRAMVGLLLMSPDFLWR
ncbi:MAG: DUF1800 domain-containing protein [Acidobacteriota bacterium]